MRPGRALAHALGYELVPRRKSRQPMVQLVRTLAHQKIDAVIDIGANQGQYGAQLRRSGFAGPIVSIEPLAAAHARLTRRAARDAAWQVLPPMALGAREGTATLEVSAESDMSSLLPQRPLLRRLSPSSAVVAHTEVPLRRLDGIDLAAVAARQRLFLKLDVQGSEADVLEGAAGLLDRVAGIQLELSLVPLYQGDHPWLEMIARVAALGFTPFLFLPGYFEPKLARQLQFDGVFYRDAAALS
jgi:FkbM family methyltransferase